MFFSPVRPVPRQRSNVRLARRESKKKITVVCLRVCWPPTDNKIVITLVSTIGHDNIHSLGRRPLASPVLLNADPLWRRNLLRTRHAIILLGRCTRIGYFGGGIARGEGKVITRVENRNEVPRASCETRRYYAVTTTAAEENTKTGWRPATFFFKSDVFPVAERRA